MQVDPEEAGSMPLEVINVAVEAGLICTEPGNQIPRPWNHYLSRAFLSINETDLPNQLIPLRPGSMISAETEHINVADSHLPVAVVSISGPQAAGLLQVGPGWDSFCIPSISTWDALELHWNVWRG